MGITNRKRPGNNSKNPPYLSHEFIIQNHGDIATCASMVFIVGLMFQSTTPLASTFIVPKYNITEPEKLPILYTYGLKDLCMVFFYTIVAIIFHAIIQEYILDKWTRKVHLSKTKSSKFNESGQLLAFYMVSTAWAAYIFQSEGYFQSLNFFWTGYPHIGLTLMTKLFFILQLSYWLHILPELYLQKVKKEEITGKVLFAGANFALTAFFYIFNFTRIGLTLIFIDHVINLVFHLSRLLYFSGKNKISHISFTVYNFLFVGARLAATVLSILVFWFSLKSSPSNVEQIKFDEGNFNTQLVRTVSLGSLLLIQAIMFWNFILFQLRRIRENVSTAKPAASSISTKTQSPKKKRVNENEESNSDANENAHNLRSKKEK